MTQPRPRLITCCAALALVASACDESGADLSILDTPRILAVRTVPAMLSAAGPTTIEALAHRVDGFGWDACPAPYTPGEPPTCPAEALPLGAGNPITATFPPLDAVWIRLLGTAADGADPLPAVHLLRADTAAENPAVLGFEGPDGPLPASVTPGAELAIHVRLGDLTRRQSVSYYTTAGRFSPLRTFGEAPTSFVAPAEPASATLYAVVRAEDGGVTWVTTALEVAP